MLLVELLQDLINKAKEAQTDLMKFQNGNTTAGVRARWTMQEVREKAKGIRAEIQKIRKQRKDDKKHTDQELPKP